MWCNIKGVEWNQETSFKWSYACYFDDQDLSTAYGVTLEACAQKCQQTTSCTHFDYYDSTAPQWALTCYMKYGVGTAIYNGKAYNQCGMLTS